MSDNELARLRAEVARLTHERSDILAAEAYGNRMSAENERLRSAITLNALPIEALVRVGNEDGMFSDELWAEIVAIAHRSRAALAQPAAEPSTEELKRLAQAAEARWAQAVRDDLTKRKQRAQPAAEPVNARRMRACPRAESMASCRTCPCRVEHDEHKGCRAGVCPACVPVKGEG